MSRALTRRQQDYTLAAPTEAERQRRGTDPRVRFGVCNTCGARLWLSGLGIGSHERGAAHNAAYNAAYLAAREERNRA